MSDKKPNKKGENVIKRQVKKRKGAGKKLDKNEIKKKELNIKVLTHELLASTLSYLILAHW
jgi:hypothetical protein